MPQNHDDLGVRVDALIVVVVQFRSRDPVPGENHRALKFRRVRERNRHEVFVDPEVFAAKLKLVL